MNFFKPEDFKYFVEMDARAIDSAHAANKLLSERGVRVYGCAHKDGWHAIDVEEIAVRQALLINIEELPKPEHKHEPTYGVPNTHEIICSCGIALKASWSPA